MSLACRHCHGKDEFPLHDPEGHGAGGDLAASSYVERLVYGCSSNMTPPSSSEDAGDQAHQRTHLQRVLEWVESKATASSSDQVGVPMPGVVVWCPDCRKMSVISYTYHCSLLRERDKLQDSAIPTQSAYYTRMCVSAEMWMHMLEMQRR